MKRMLWIVSVCLAVALPTIAVARQTSDAAAHSVASAAPSATPDVCAAAGDAEAGVNPEYLWRLRADRQLGCVIGMLEQALQVESEVVTLSRRDAERIRALAFSAKDAAARIGR